MNSISNNTNNLNINSNNINNLTILPIGDNNSKKSLMTHVDKTQLLSQLSHISKDNDISASDNLFPIDKNNQPTLYDS
jgi:hypothetical protein